MTRSRLMLCLMVAAAGLVLLVLMVVDNWPGDADPPASRQAAPAHEAAWPSSPYLNTAREAALVGDRACADCHAEIAAQYRRHPMGRSVAPVTAEVATDIADRAGQDSFTTEEGLTYQVRVRDGQLMHVETRKDEQGGVLHQQQIDAQYVVGSGRHAQSFLFQRDGHFFYSPVTWYSQTGRWSLSPAFVRRNARLNLAVEEQCVWCHTNRPRKTGGGINHFELPADAIGCERCHGPGSLHVERHASGQPSPEEQEVDYSIVNPGRLQPKLRDAVCQSCHLEGLVRVTRAGRALSDFRPGLPLHEFVSVFVEPKQQSNAKRFVGHVQQMEASRCYQESGGKLGCISCHDPHRLPPPETTVQYFRTRCLQCHAVDDCELPHSDRLKLDRQDDCISCHMPTLDDLDINHVAITDHRILKTPGALSDESGEERKRSSEELLVHFHREQIDERRAGYQRDLGIALAQLGRRGPVSIRQQALRDALPKLTRAVRTHPEDVDAWHWLAVARWKVGQLSESERAFEKTLSIDGQRESTLFDAAALAMQLEQYPRAAQLWSRVVAVNPWNNKARLGWADALLFSNEVDSSIAQYQETLRRDAGLFEARQGLADAMMARQKWDEAAEQYEIVLRYDPDRAAVRQNLIICYRRSGDRQSAADHQRILNER